MKKLRAGLTLVLATAVVAGSVIVTKRLFRATPRERCRVLQRWGASTPAAAAGLSASSSDTAQIFHPMGLAWADGVLYAADAERGAILRYRADGSRLPDWTGFARPVAVAPTTSAVHGTVYVADYLSDRITALNSDGTVARVWGRHGKGAGEFDAPSGVAVDRRGNVYVTDFYNHRVQQFTAGGKFVREWGNPGRRSGEFRYPTGIAVAPSGDILVADGFNNRVQRFTAEGRYLARWGGTGFGFGGKWPGWFRLAKDVAVDSRGNVYVTDAFNGRLQKFTPDGRLLALWGDRDREGASLRYASGVAVDSGGNVYVGDWSRNRIWKLECR